MLNQMRHGAGGVAAKILLGLLILSFGVWGIEDMLRSSGSSGALATVGGHEISRSAFLSRYNREVNKVRTSLGKNYTPELVKMLGIDRQVLDQLVTAELLRLEAHSLGIIVGDDVVIGELKGNPAFLNDQGKFDKARFAQVIRQNNLTEKALADSIRTEKTNELLLGTLAAAAPLNDTLIATQYAAEAEERTADIAVLTPALIKDVPTPSEAELQAYYKQHANAFLLPETREFSYITVKQDDVLKNVTVSDAELKKLYAERKAMFGDADVAPYDKVKDDLLKELRVERGEEAVNTFSKKLEDLLAGGSTPQEAAKELGLGFATFGPVTSEGNSPSGAKLALPFENLLEVASRVEEGGDSPLTPTKGGTYFLVHMDKVTPEQPEPFAKVRTKVASAWENAERMSRVKTLGDTIAKELKDNKDAYAVFAKHGIATQPSGAIRRGNPKTSTNMQLPAGLIRELFGLKKGQATGPFPASNGTMIAVMKDRRASAPLTPDMMAKDGGVKLLREKLDKDTRRDVLEEYLTYLRTKYSVKVNDEALSALNSNEP